MKFEIKLKKPEGLFQKYGDYRWELLQYAGDIIVFWGWGIDDRICKAAHAHAKRHGFLVKTKTNKYHQDPSVEVWRISGRERPV